MYGKLEVTEINYVVDCFNISGVSSYTRFRTPLRQKPGVNKIKCFFPLFDWFFFCSSNYKRLVSVKSLVPSANLLKCHSQSVSCAYRSSSFLEEIRACRLVVTPVLHAYSNSLDFLQKTTQNGVSRSMHPKNLRCNSITYDRLTSKWESF